MDNSKALMAAISLALLAGTAASHAQGQPCDGGPASSPVSATSHSQPSSLSVEGQWQSFDAALAMGRAKLDAGQCDWVMRKLIPALDAVASATDKQWLVRELEAQALLRAKSFGKSAKVYAAVAEGAEGPTAFRCGTIADILKDNADGMYVLSETYPPTAVLTATRSAAAIRPGPASLAEPMVLEAAIRDRAKKEVDAGRKLMDAAQAIDRVDPDGAKAKYAQAGQAFDRADWLVEGISRSYRIEIARRRIADMRKGTDADAERFDTAMDKLGQQNLSGQEYRTTVLNLVQLLDNVRDNLQAVLAAAKAYPQDLLLEVKWAEIDLKKLDAMRKVLLDEINGQE